MTWGDAIRALPAVQPDAAALIRWHDMLLRDFGDDLSSIVRAEMLAMLDKPGKEVMPDVPNDAPNAPDAAPASTDDAGGGAEPTAVQTDAHVNETPKSEHEAANVLKLSVQGKAREAALREAAAACIWDDGDASRAAILALIDKPAHD